MTKEQSMRKEIEKILNKTFDDTYNLMQDVKEYGIFTKRHEKEAKKIENKHLDQILTLLDKEIRKARIELANNLKSIEYPPSGKEWHFNDGTWTNNITELEGKK